MENNEPKELLNIEEDVEEELDVIIDNDIRRLNFWKYYLKPNSETYGNALQSAIKAGFSKYYSKTITTKPFFKKKLRHMNLYRSAEKVLEDALNVVHINEEGKVDAATLRVKVDTAKHVTKNLGKDDGWTERAELGGKDGQPIVFIPTELMDKYKLSEKVEEEEEDNKE